MKPSILFLLFIYGITAGCFNNREVQSDSAPWEGLSYLKQVKTSFSLVNTSRDSITYQFSLNMQAKFGTLVGNLGPEDSINFEQDLFLPLAGYLVINDIFVTGPYLMPGIDRKLRWSGSELLDSGPNHITYSYLQLLNRAYPFRGDESLLGLPLDDVHEHGLGLFEGAIERSKAFTSKEQLPVWLLDFYHREAALRSSEALESQRGYLAYAYADSIELSSKVHLWIDSLLADPANLIMPAFMKLRRYHSYNEASGPSPGVTIKNRNSRLDFENIVDSIPVEKIGLRHDILAAWTETQLRSFSTYEMKDELIASALEKLPEAYVNQLNYIRDSINTQLSSDNSALDLLSSPFLTVSNSMIPLLHRKKPFTLYKFWFPGCRPCLRQYPFERKLLAEHQNLELVNVAYSTRKDHWSEYIQKHDMPGSQHFYLPKQRTKEIQAAIGILGAPRYLMMGPDDKLICRDCPKPEDTLLASLIKS